VQGHRPPARTAFPGGARCVRASPRGARPAQTLCTVGMQVQISKQYYTLYTVHSYTVLSCTWRRAYSTIHYTLIHCRLIHSYTHTLYTHTLIHSSTHTLIHYPAGPSSPNLRWRALARFAPPSSSLSLTHTPPLFLFPHPHTRMVAYGGVCPMTLHHHTTPT
jgi:hypothetical protein